MTEKIKFSLFLLAFSFLFAGNIHAIARHNHTMAVLPDGNFISCGGIGSAGTALNSCDLYNTKTNKVSTNTFGGARAYHTMTVLSDGRVLATGGKITSAGTPLNTAAIFDGASWAATGNMISNRAEHSATLITRGADAGNVLICGGQTDTLTATNSCEIFITSATAAPYFKPGPSMSSSRKAHTATLLSNGKILISGGINNSGYYMSTQELYDNINNTFTPAASLYEGRAYHNAVGLNNGNVLIFGGYNGLNLADRFSLDTSTTQSRQGQGTWGYLESAEMFGPDGANVHIGGGPYGVMPLRFSRNSAALMPDGKVVSIGGYGNIPVSYFNISPELEDASYVTLSTSVYSGPDTGIRTAQVTGGTISFKVDANFSRPVTARIVEGDIFFSQPDDPSMASVEIDNAKIYNLWNSTAVVDGGWIGTETPGRFFEVVTLSNLAQISPTPYAEISPVNVTATNAIITSGTMNFTPSPLAVAQAGTISNTSSITVDLTFKIPGIYARGGVTVTGTVTVKSANITYTDLSSPTVMANFNIGGAGGIDSGYASIVNAPVTADYDNGTLVGVVTVNNVVITGLRGSVINNSETSPLASGVDVSAQLLENPNFEFSFTPNRVYLNLPNQNSPTTFLVGKSTAVIRQAVFADEIRFSPKEAAWEFNNIYSPVFDNAMILTPAADIYTRGGQNCESDPSQCIRSSPNFTAQDISGVGVMQKFDTWLNGSFLKNKRAFHTSTLLPTGDILTCGGTDGMKTLSSCELYLSSADVSVFVSSMTSPRAFHTATLLSNGNVLLAGGTDGSSELSPALKSADIYYPSTRRVIRTSSMTYARMMHTATMMADGNIVVIGGSTNGSYTNTAEIYISTSETWQPITATLANGRSQHTATFMKNNTILIAGGVNGSGVLNSAEVFNPLTRTFATPPGTGGGTMNSRRAWHTANLLKDGRVMVIGGTDSGGIPGSSAGILETSEIYDPSAPQAWTTVENMGGNKNLSPRAGHTTTLLPNGKLIIVGGARPGMPQNFAEGYDVDFTTFQYQGETDYRVGHTAVLLSTGYLVAIGGFDGVEYLDTADAAYYSYEPDSQGRESFKERLPSISTATQYVDRGGRITLLSDTTNFHGITEASGGGGGVRNSSFSNPRIYLNAVDNPSSFLVDLTTRIYVSGNSNWETTLSSLSINLPFNPGELPYGWYSLHVANNGQFSNGFLLQVTSARPTGLIAGPITCQTQSTTTLKWNWSRGSISLSDGYAVFSSSNDVFISTMALLDPVTFYQSGLAPNSEVSIKVTGYNMGGYGNQFVKSATYYTFANPPRDVEITEASFETARVEWNPNGNSDLTVYELTISLVSDFSAEVSTPVPFSDKLTSTAAVIIGLRPNTLYYFRVRAQNGAGVPTAFDDKFEAGTAASTVTVGDVGNLHGTSMSPTTIRWDWDESEGADGYWVYDLNITTYTLILSSANAVLIGSTSYNHYTQVNLSSNTPYGVMVYAFKDMPPLGSSVGDITGPPAIISTPVYTLAAPPLPNQPNVFTNVKADMLTVNWKSNGNPYYTMYGVAISTSNQPDSYSTYTVVGTSLTLTGLLPNYPYYVKLAAINGDENLSQIVDLGSKYTRANPPLDVVATTVTMSGVFVEWDPQGNSTSTYYEVRGTTVTPSGNQDFTIAVTTYIPFSELYTSTAAELTGLWTNTTYYFDVSAKNKEGYETARTPLYDGNAFTPYVVTKPGPAGTPAGAIGGVSDPNQDTEIEGYIYDEYYDKANPDRMRPIKITLPKKSFSVETQIAIAKSTTNSCGWLVEGDHPLEFAIYANTQPKEPITLEFSYSQDEAYSGTNGIDTNRTKLMLARYNPVTGQCLPLETTIDQGNRRITSKLNHLSIFQLMIFNPAADLNDVTVYPNPFYPNRAGQSSVAIIGMPAGSNIKIFTLNGEKIYETFSNGSGTAYWDGKNKKGQFVGSGVYLCLIKSGTSKKIFKIAVER